MRRLILVFATTLAMITSTTAPAQAETVQWASSAEASSSYGASPTPEDIAQAMAFYLLTPAEVLMGPAFSVVDLLGPALGPTVEVLLCSIFSASPCVPDDPEKFAEDTADGASTIPDNAPGFVGGLPDTVVGAATELPDATVNTVIGAPVALERAQKGSAWSKEQATGAPDTFPSCGDIATAWAPQSSGSDPEWLEVFYFPPVENAKRIDIYETHIGGFVTSVDITLADGSTQTVFEGPDNTPCAGLLSIDLTGNPTVQSVKINTQAPGWEEIDAVGVIS